jgi:Ni/Co efflux regulator RcnB
MNKVIATLLAAALVVPVAAQAQPMQRHDQARYSQQDRGDRYDRRPQATPSRQQQQMHRFARGERFDRNRAANYRRLDYRQVRRLSVPGRNQMWVRSGDDALLVSLRNNTVQRIVPNAF